MRSGTTGTHRAFWPVCRQAPGRHPDLVGQNRQGNRKAGRKRLLPQQQLTPSRQAESDRPRRCRQPEKTVPDVDRQLEIESRESRLESQASNRIPPRLGNERKEGRKDRKPGRQAGRQAGSETATRRCEWNTYKYDRLSEHQLRVQVVPPPVQQGYTRALTCRSGRGRPSSHCAQILPIQYKPRVHRLRTR